MTAMTAMSIRLLESLHRNARAYAEQEGVSINQLISSALAEKLAALAAQDYLVGPAKFTQPSPSLIEPRHVRQHEVACDSILASTD